MIKNFLNDPNRLYAAVSLFFFVIKLVCSLLKKNLFIRINLYNHILFLIFNTVFFLYTVIKFELIEMLINSNLNAWLVVIFFLIIIIYLIRYILVFKNNKY